jgi:hypothetical protein
LKWVKSKVDGNYSANGYSGVFPECRLIWSTGGIMMVSAKKHSYKDSKERGNT